MSIPGQKLRGFVGQSMSGKREAARGYTYQFRVGSHTFTPPVNGRWKLVLWGPGADSGANPGGSGGYCEVTRPLTRRTPVSLVVGSPGTDTTATFSNQTVVTASAASGINGGAATGGDVNLAGSAGGAAGASGANGAGTGGGTGGTGNGATDGGGAGAPGVLPFMGGHGGSGSGRASGGFPGGGASDVGGSFPGGDGLIIAYLVNPSA